MAYDDNLKDLTVDEIMETLNEAQAKFILQASVIAGHLKRDWLEKGVYLSRSINTY